MRLCWVPRYYAVLFEERKRTPIGATMANDGFLERYRRFFHKRDHAEGFEFHDPPPKSIPPPTVGFRQKLRWWSWDRWKRRTQIRQERDRRLQDILRIKQQPPRTP